MPTPSPDSTIFFVCDVQTKFRPAIRGFDQVVITANKLLKLAKVTVLAVFVRCDDTHDPLHHDAFVIAQILGCEVVCTTQYVKALGPVDPAIDLASVGDLHVGTFDKPDFSMVTKDIEAVLKERPAIRSVVLFGIEAHICILQTALSLLNPTFRQQPYVPYIVADGVSSSNGFEVPIALERLRQEGAVITTSESLGYELLRTAADPRFKAFSQYVKDTKAGTVEAAEVLILGKKNKDTDIQ